MAPKIPNIPNEKRSDEINQLYAVLRYQSEVIQELRDEIARLKGQKGKPKIRPSVLGKDKTSKDPKNENKKEDRDRDSKKDNKRRLDGKKRVGIKDS